MTKHRPYSITLRLAISLTMVATFMVMLSLAGAYLYVNRSLEKSLQAEAEEKGRYLSGALSIPMWELNTPAVQGIMDTFCQSETVTAVTVEQAQFGTVYAFTRAGAESGLTRHVSVEYRNQTLGEVVFSLTASEARKRMVGYFWVVFATLIVLALIMFGVTRFFIARYMKTPLQALSRLARSHAAGEYSASTLQLPYIELAPLERSLQDMGARITETIASLRQSEREFRLLFESSQIPLAVVDKFGVIKNLNRRFVHLFGYELYEIPSIQTWGRRVFPDAVYREKMLADWLGAVRCVETQCEDIEGLEATMVTRGGETVDVIVSGTFLGDRVLLAFIDMTERKRFEQELAISRDQAQEASKAKSVFLANMSHEIRTPINGLYGMLQLLEGTEPTPEQAEYLDAAFKSVQRLTRLLSDILDISRIEAGHMPLVTTVFAVEDLRAAILELFGAPAREKQLDLVFEIDAGVPRFLVSDEARLRQILFNLVGNAIKFTERGAVHVSLSMLPGCRKHAARLLIVVEDTGIGISDEQLLRICDPFVQAEESYTRRYQGAGLGLSIVGKLLTLLGGEMAMDHEPGQGMSMYVSVPVGIGREVEAAEPPAVSAPPAAEMTGLRILLAEDDAVSQQAARRLLEKSGHTVDAVGDGEEAMAMLENGEYDLVIMDIQMPVRDGVATTRAIRAAKSLGDKCRIPVIAMTAYAMVGDREKFVQAGMDDCVTKPVNLREMTACIARVMRTRYSGGRS